MLLHQFPRWSNESDTFLPPGEQVSGGGVLVMFRGLEPQLEGEEPRILTTQKNKNTLLQPRSQSSFFFLQWLLESVCVAMAIRRCSIDRWGTMMLILAAECLSQPPELCLEHARWTPTDGWQKISFKCPLASVLQKNSKTETSLNRNKATLNRNQTLH